MKWQGQFDLPLFGQCVYEREGVVKKFLVMGVTNIGKVASLELTVEEVFFQLFCSLLSDEGEMELFGREEDISLRHDDEDGRELEVVELLIVRQDF